MQRLRLPLASSIRIRASSSLAHLHPFPLTFPAPPILPLPGLWAFDL